MLGRALDEAIDHDFFRWFHLARYEAPRRLTDSANWHGFRPEGPKFRNLVTVNLESDHAERITDAKLCLDRAFVEHAKDGAFARDITASFLRWVLPGEDQARIADFLTEIGDLGPNVIRMAGRMAGRMPVPVSPKRPSALHRVYLGSDKDVECALSGKILRISNLQARDGPRAPEHDWIWIRVFLK